MEYYKENNNGIVNMEAIDYLRGYLGLDPDNSSF